MLFRSQPENRESMQFSLNLLNRQQQNWRNWASIKIVTVHSVLSNIAKIHSRACLKNHFRNQHAPLCGIFHPNSVAVAHYGALIRSKYPTNCDAHLAENPFQTVSSNMLWQSMERFHRFLIACGFLYYGTTASLSII